MNVGRLGSKLDHEILELLSVVESTSNWKKYLAGAAVTLSGAWLADTFLRWKFGATESGEQLHHTTTEDGVRIGIWRHTPDHTNPGEPVLVVHGLGVNHYHMDLGERCSVAEYLSSRGYDCWVVELRGRGISETPDESWNFDDFAQRDLPSAVDYVLEQTGKSMVHFVGHSMGGMLYYALAGAVGYSNKLASAVSAGGPFHGKRAGGPSRGNVNYPFGADSSGYTTVFVPILELLRRLRLPYPASARWAAVGYPVLKKLVPRQILQIMINPDNISHSMVLKAAVRAPERLEATVLEQFLDWGLNRYWVDSSGQLDYRKGISEIETPTLLIAGSADNMVPVHNQESGFEQLGCEDKKLEVVGKDQGYAANYSHADMLYGPKAVDEVYPLILEWLKDHPITTAGKSSS